MRIARRLRRITPQRAALLAASSMLLLRTRFALWLLPWPRLLERVNPPIDGFASRFAVHELEWAVRIASRIVPRATCLTQALTLDHLLHRAGYSSLVRIGVARRSGPFAAHAWVEHGGMPLLSRADEIAQYAPLITWPPNRPDRCR
jgi:hypothetical protein